MLAGIFGLIFALILIFIKYYFELLLKENRREVLRIINLFGKILPLFFHIKVKKKILPSKTCFINE